MKRGEIISMNRNGILVIVDDKHREKERYPVVYGARITVAEGDRSKPTRSCSNGIRIRSRS